MERVKLFIVPGRIRDERARKMLAEMAIPREIILLQPSVPQLRRTLKLPALYYRGVWYEGLEAISRFCQKFRERRE